MNSCESCYLNRHLADDYAKEVKYRQELEKVLEKTKDTLRKLADGVPFNQRRAGMAEGFLTSLEIIEVYEEEVLHSNTDNKEIW